MKPLWARGPTLLFKRQSNLHPATVREPLASLSTKTPVLSANKMFAVLLLIASVLLYDGALMPKISTSTKFFEKNKTTRLPDAAGTGCEIEESARIRDVLYVGKLTSNAPRVFKNSWSGEGGFNMTELLQCARYANSNQWLVASADPAVLTAIVQHKPDDVLLAHRTTKSFAGDGNIYRGNGNVHLGGLKGFDIILSYVAEEGFPPDPFWRTQWDSGFMRFAPHLEPLLDVRSLKILAQERKKNDT